jgi:hypothetical protein
MKVKKLVGLVVLFAILAAVCCLIILKHIVQPPKATGDATLANLTISGGILKPAFNPNTTLYQVGPLAWIGDSVMLTPTVNDPKAKIAVNGVDVASATPSAPISLGAVTTIGIAVIAVDGVTTKDYTVVVHKTSSTYLKASNTEANGDFGHSVSISGDTIVVGAPCEDSNATGVNGNQANIDAMDSGAAYVFTRTAGVWSQQAYLKASNTETGDHFGASVSISGNMIVVGAYTEGSNATGVNGNQADNSAIQ